MQLVLLHYRLESMQCLSEAGLYRGDTENIPMLLTDHKYILSGLPEINCIWMRRVKQGECNRDWDSPHLDSWFGCHESSKCICKQTESSARFLSHSDYCITAGRQALLQCDNTKPDHFQTVINRAHVSRQTDKPAQLFAINSSVERPYQLLLLLNYIFNCWIVLMLVMLNGLLWCVKLNWIHIIAATLCLKLNGLSLGVGGSIPKEVSIPPILNIVLSIDTSISNVRLHSEHMNSS